MRKLFSISRAAVTLAMLEEFKDVTCIAHLNWTKMPEAAKEVQNILTSNGRVTIFKLNNDTFVEVQDEGLFQIM
jgi:hypothetical protein